MKSKGMKNFEEKRELELTSKQDELFEIINKFNEEIESIAKQNEKYFKIWGGHISTIKTEEEKEAKDNWYKGVYKINEVRDKQKPYYDEFYKISDELLEIHNYKEIKEPRLITSTTYERAMKRQHIETLKRLGVLK